MANFVLNTPIETDVPTIEVTLSATNGLALGRHRFQLVVVDDSNNESAADVVEVRVIDSQRPTADITGPDSVPFGTSFPLSGVRSSDVGGGRIVRYRWTYIGAAPVIVGPILNPGTPILSPTP